MNSGSTGRIAEDIGNVLIASQNESFIAYGRGDRPSASKLIRIGSKKDILIHGIATMFFDRHGFGSAMATKQLLKRIVEIKPDIVQLHNIHGYYLNIEILFNFLKASMIPVVWTLHDSWAYTGHCTYYESVACTKWQSECYQCPKKKFYPTSYFLDQSKRNFRDKKRLYADMKNLYLVTPSYWLAGEVRKSFLKDRELQVIHNGIDIIQFELREFIPTIISQNKRKIVLGVASTWDQRKGLEDFKKLSVILPEDYQIVLLGLSEQQLAELPSSIIGHTRTENAGELAEFYSAAAVFVNPTWQDNFPTTNLEALACGTPVITYDTGGSPEAIDVATGRIVNKGDINGLMTAIQELTLLPESDLRFKCRQRAINKFDKNDRYTDYLTLYAKILGSRNGGA